MNSALLAVFYTTSMLDALTSASFWASRADGADLEGRKLGIALSYAHTLYDMGVDPKDIKFSLGLGLTMRG